MERIQHFIQRFFPPAHRLPAGIYHYQAPSDAVVPLRLHLRLDPSGEAVLIVNASIVLRLNQTAAELAYYLVQQVGEAEVGQKMESRYHIKAEIAAQDFREFKQRLETLIKTPNLDPVGFLGFERSELYSSATTAPYRLDCALTYHLSDGERPKKVPLEREKRELNTDEWQTILQKAWNAGIPHAVFTGGEPTLRPDLVDLIAFTESLGMVSGLLTDGLRLAESHYLHQLLQSGLDYVMLLLNPDEEQSWEALRDLLAEDISVTVHLTVTTRNSLAIPALLDRFELMGVKLISLSVDDPVLKETLTALRQLTAEKGLSLVWDLPVPYSRFHPVAFETAEGEQVQGAGKAWLYIEPDGDVLPGQGIDQVMGNFLNDDWDAIWAKRPR
jgi:hypothetical protein